MIILIGVACAVLFFRVATYERMSPWLWTISSLGLAVIFGALVPSITLMLVAQVVLFLVLWWYNAQRPNNNQGL